MAQDNQSVGRKTTQRWLYIAISLWVISFLLMSGFATYSIIRARQLNNELCHVSDDNRNIIADIVEVARQQALEAATDTLERELIRQRYNELRALIPPLKCTVQGGPQEFEP